jgi:hypothetical protein
VESKRNAVASSGLFLLRSLKRKAGASNSLPADDLSGRLTARLDVNAGAGCFLATMADGAERVRLRRHRHCSSTSSTSGITTLPHHRE